jgi:hypothetical protein
LLTTINNQDAQIASPPIHQIIDGEKILCSLSSFIVTKNSKLFVDTTIGNLEPMRHNVKKEASTSSAVPSPQPEKVSYLNYSSPSQF